MFTRDNNIRVQFINMYKCHECNGEFRNLNKHKCKFKRYPKVYVTMPEFQLLVTQLGPEMTIDVLRYLHVTDWQNQVYWTKRFHQLHSESTQMLKSLVSRYGHFTLLAWHLVIPLHILSKCFNDIAMRTRRSRLMLSTTVIRQPLLSVKDYVRFTRQVQRIYEFYQNVNMVKRVIIPLDLKSMMSQWFSNVKAMGTTRAMGTTEHVHCCTYQPPQSS